jgi:ribosomal protein S18 acetylase RimI-like enzyme
MSPNDVAIRRARPGDASAIAEGQREIAKTPGRLGSRPHEIDDETIRDVIAKLESDDRGLFLVAHREGDGAIVGHGLLKRREPAVLLHVVELTLAVHEGHQGGGIGRRLMNELIAWARATPYVEKIELQVRSSNERAIALYDSLGFVEEGRKTKRIKLGPNEYLDDVYMAMWVASD